MFHQSGNQLVNPVETTLLHVVFEIKVKSSLLEMECTAVAVVFVTTLTTAVNRISNILDVMLHQLVLGANDINNDSEMVIMKEKYQ